MTEQELYDKYYYFKDRLDHYTKQPLIRKSIIKFYIDALECGSSLVKDLYSLALPYIYVNCQEMSTKTYSGCVISFSNCTIDTWAAINDNGSIKSDILIASFKLYESFNYVVSKTIQEANICPVCHKNVGFNNQKLYGYANRCCMDCYNTKKEEDFSYYWKT